MCLSRTRATILTKKIIKIVQNQRFIIVDFVLFIYNCCIIKSLCYNRQYMKMIGGSLCGVSCHHWKERL